MRKEGSESFPRLFDRVIRVTMTKQTTDKNDQTNLRDHHRSLESVMTFTAPQLYEVQERTRLGHSGSEQNIHKEPLEIPEAALN